MLESYVGTAIKLLWKLYEMSWHLRRFKDLDKWNKQLTTYKVANWNSAVAKFVDFLNSYYVESFIYC